MSHVPVGTWVCGGGCTTDNRLPSYISQLIDELGHKAQIMNRRQPQKQAVFDVKEMVQISA